MHYKKTQSCKSRRLSYQSGVRPNTLDRKIREAYTLIELMVVIAIIGLLAAATTVGVRHFLIKGRQNTARMEIAAIETSLELYKEEMKTYPDEGKLAELETLSKLTGEKYIKGDTTDPWGNAYDFYIEDGQVVIKCYGSDGEAGGTGAARDITNLDDA